MSDTNDHEVKVKTEPIDNELVSDTNDHEIKVKTEPVDNEPVEIQFSQNNDKTWVKGRDISLTCYDKDILERGEKLSNKHINLAQRILKTKFPNINGLHLTFLQEKFHKESAKNALQIIHTGGDHWICACTIGISGKRVLVYDSAYTKWDESSLCLLKKQFQCSPSNMKGYAETAGRKGMWLICHR